MRLTAEEYLEKRLVPEMDYYDQRASWNKTWFQIMSVLSIVSATSVPVIAAMGFTRPLAIVGAITTIAIATQSLFKWQENWLKFRGGYQSLKKEKLLYATRTGPYLDVEDQKLVGVLTDRVENIISSEHDEWQQARQRDHRTDSTS